METVILKTTIAKPIALPIIPGHKSRRGRSGCGNPVGMWSTIVTLKRCWNSPKCEQMVAITILIASKNHSILGQLTIHFLQLIKLKIKYLPHKFGRPKRFPSGFTHHVARERNAVKRVSLCACKLSRFVKHWWQVQTIYFIEANLTFFYKLTFIERHFCKPGNIFWKLFQLFQHKFSTFKTSSKWQNFLKMWNESKKHGFTGKLNLLRTNRLELASAVSFYNDRWWTLSPNKLQSCSAQKLSTLPDLLTVAAPLGLCKSRNSS